MLRIFKRYYPIRNIFFVLGEGVAIFISVLIASYLIISTETFSFDSSLILKILLITLVSQTCLYYADLYDLKVTDTFLELGIRLLKALGIAAFFLAVIYIIYPGFIIGSNVFSISAGLLILLIVSWRFGYSLVLTHGLFNKKIILLGSGELASEIKREIQQRQDCGYSVALVCAERFVKKDNPGDIVSQGINCNRLYERALKIGADRIVVAGTDRIGSLPEKDLLRCRMEGIDVTDGNSFYEMLTGKLFVENVQPAWWIFSGGFRRSPFGQTVKRCIDLILSAVMLAALLPLVIVTAILIKLQSEGPVIYSQDRVGKNRKLFRIHKFRSMVKDAEKQTGPAYTRIDDPRITRVGKHLRKWHIDEVPQLWNVLKGEMSFVGPRPERQLLADEYGAQIPFYDKRFLVKPGLTGWAQINYGYGDSLDDYIEKLKYDLFYIKNWSILMDLMIVLRTIKTVLFAKGAR